jgi:hypothetical protein
MRFAVFLSMVLGIVTLSAQDHVLSLQQINRLGAKVPAPAYNMKETDRAEILKMLEASFDYGTAVLQSFSD